MLHPVNLILNGRNMNSKQRRKFTRTYKDVMAVERVSARLTGTQSWLPFHKVRAHDQAMYFDGYTAAQLEYKNALYCRQADIENAKRLLENKIYR